MRQPPTLSVISVSSTAPRSRRLRQLARTGREHFIKNSSTCVSVIMLRAMKVWLCRQILSRCVSETVNAASCSSVSMTGDKVPHSRGEVGEGGCCLATPVWHVHRLIERDRSHGQLTMCLFGVARSTVNCTQAQMAMGWQWAHLAVLRLGPRSCWYSATIRAVGVSPNTWRPRPAPTKPTPGAPAPL